MSMGEGQYTPLPWLWSSWDVVAAGDTQMSVRPGILEALEWIHLHYPKGPTNGDLLVCDFPGLALSRTYTQ